MSVYLGWSDILSSGGMTAAGVVFGGPGLIGHVEPPVGLEFPVVFHGLVKVPLERLEGLSSGFVLVHTTSIRIET